MVAGAAQPKWDILEAVILLDGYVALLNGKQNRQQTIKDVSMQLRKMANNKGQAIDDETPIHLAAELDVIEAAISTAATELAMHKCQAFVIASDHGSSRLAVIKRQEVPYDTDTKGEHSGRCCKTFENCNLQYKVEENEYIALADYGRFRGSRAANV